MNDEQEIRKQAATIPAMPSNVADIESPLWVNSLDVQAALEAPVEQLDFVLPGLLAGTVGMLVSAGGAGKSMLALGLAATIAAGSDAWGLVGSNPKQGPVLVLSLEDPEVILRLRLRALDASRYDVVKTSAARDQFRVLARHGTGFVLGAWDPKGGMSPSSSYKILARELAELQPRLLVVDTFNRALGGMAENDNSVQGAVIGLIESLIAPTKTAALVLHHTSKNSALSGQGDTPQSTRGAGAITDNARFQANLVGMTEKEAGEYSIDKHDRNRYVRLIVTKSNYASTPPHRWLQREKNGVLSGLELLQPEKPRKGKRPHDID